MIGLIHSASSVDCKQVPLRTGCLPLVASMFTTADDFNCFSRAGRSQYSTSLLVYNGMVCPQRDFLQASANATSSYDLYIVLFARTSVPRTYHWALLICPPDSPSTATTGIRYHVTNSIQASTIEVPNPPTPDLSGRVPWRFEAQALAKLFTASPLLARVLISRDVDPTNVKAVLGAVPLIQNDKAWTCRVWIRDALASLARQGVINLPSQLPPSLLEHASSGRLSLTEEAWAVVESRCLAYLETKHNVHRWRDASEGRWVEGQVPTWALEEERELVA